MDDLKADVENKEYLSTQVVQLICYKDQQYRLIGFKHVTRKILEYCRQIRIMHETHPSNYFNKKWKMVYASKRDTERLTTLFDLTKELWKEVFEVCERYVKRFQDKSIQLSEVEATFAEYQPFQIKTELESLYKGISECKTVNPDISWVKGVVDTIQHYRKLEQYSGAAEAFLQLKSCLKLKGDFNDVHDISVGVSSYFIQPRNILQRECTI